MCHRKPTDKTRRVSFSTLIKPRVPQARSRCLPTSSCLACRLSRQPSSPNAAGSTPSSAPHLCLSPLLQ